MSDLHLTLAPISSAAELRATVLAGEDSPHELPLTVETDGTVDDAAQPRSLAVATVGFELYIDGQTVPLAAGSGSWSITRSIDQRLQTWQIEFPLPSPFKDGACKRRVSLSGVYRTATGEHRVPLIRDGLVDVTVCTVNGSGGARESVSGVDCGGRYDRKRVTLVLLPGHNLPRSRVIAELAAEAGVPDVRLAGGAGGRKEVQIVDGDWLSVASEIATVEGRALLWDRDGVLVWCSTSRPDGEPVRWSFDERDFDAAAGVVIERVNDVLTDVTLTTWEQLPASDCAPEQSSLETTVTGLRNPETQAFRQVASLVTPTTWSFTPVVPPAPDDVPRTLSIVRTERIKRCGVVLWERVREWGWRNWMLPRLRWGMTDGSGPSYGAQPVGCYVNDNDTGLDGGSEGYEFKETVFGLISQTEAWHFYNWRGYTAGSHPASRLPPLLGKFASHFAGNWRAWSNRPPGAGGAIAIPLDENGDPLPIDERMIPSAPAVAASGPHALAGSYLGSATIHVAPKWLRAAVRTTDHDGERFGPFALGTYLAAGGGYGIAPVGVSTHVLAWRLKDFVSGVPYGHHASRHLPPLGGHPLLEAPWPVAYELRAIYDEEESGSISSEEKVTHGWGLLPGGSYVYGDGATYRSETEEFVEVGTEVTTYETIDEAAHVMTATNSDIGGAISTRREEREGAAPFVPRLSLPEIDEALYTDGGGPVPSRRGETRNVEVRVHAAGLEACHPKGELTTSMEWAESEEELLAVGERMIADSSAARVRATLAGCNFYLEPGEVHRWRVRAAALDHLVRVVSVTWTTDGQRLTTEVEGRAYGW